jgi:hypothetical protein
LGYSLVLPSSVFGVVHEEKVELIFCCLLLVLFGARYGWHCCRAVTIKKIMPDG